MRNPYEEIIRTQGIPYVDEKQNAKILKTVGSPSRLSASGQATGFHLYESSVGAETEPCSYDINFWV